MKRKLWIIVIIFLLSINNIKITLAEGYIKLGNTEIFNSVMLGDYNLLSIDLRLPEEDMRIFDEETQNKLLDLAESYGGRKIDLDGLTKRVKMIQPVNYIFNLEQEDRLFFEFFPGVSVNAEYNKNKDDLITEENTNISLNYWMNNRTLIRAEYGRENREWWNIVNINLSDSNNEEQDNGINDDNLKMELQNDNKSNGQVIDEINYDGSIKERNLPGLVIYEERLETGKVGISYKTNDYLTISADYINDLNALSRGYSTIFGVEYKDDDLGSLRYHYQLDRGNENARATGLEFAFKDLATFNATYKIYNPETIEEQLNQWIFGLGLNLNDNSTLSFEYLWKQDNVGEDLLEEENKDESNIKARLEIKF